MAFLKLIRWPNLLIVILTQSLFFWFIAGFFEVHRIQTELDLLHFTLLVLTTLIIAAGGYIINDISDYEIDKINKPERMILGSTFSLTSAKWSYWLLNSLGAGIALYLAFYVQKLNLFLIYPAAVLIMYVYSKKLKQTPLLGNLVVALFSAFVPGIVWFAERAGFAQLPEVIGNQMSGLFLFYMVFAFGSTLFRELIKDMEDMEGDLKNNCRTLPIVLGIPKAKQVGWIFILTLLTTILYWMISQWSLLSEVLIAISFILLLVPGLVVLGIFSMAKSKTDFYKLSQVTKLFMVCGLIYLCLFMVLR